ncbi:MAG: maleylpyruvate isomerase family mycothiol-dependent enzyme [Actinomycetota bacterium]|nr:maleylpyruvate isomerase family mycothiol-dependent enzyme [Actinomycetota bacterium]
MLLTPRYEGPPVLRFTGPVSDLSVPLLRQRRRTGAFMASLDDAQWASATRCEGWSVRDVIAHLVGTDQFWVVSATAAIAGTPTRYLAAFDPVVTPAQMVSGTRDVAPAEILATYLDGIEALGDVLTGLDDAQWSLPAEAPPGHVPLHALARHALWDAWIHERDIVLPLGGDPIEEPDEVRASLQYAAALGPALLATTGTSRPGTLVLDGTDPEAHVVVEAGETVVVSDATPSGGTAPSDAVRLAGRSVELVEALSLRAPFPRAIAEDERWLFAGLASAFDQAPQG